MKKKTKSKILVSSAEGSEEIVDALIDEAERILRLAKLRDTLALGRPSPLRTKSEVSLSKEIAKRVDALSASIIQRFKAQLTEDDD